MAEGTNENVSLAIQAILKAMSGFVDRHSLAWSQATGEFPDFRIRANEP